MSDSVRTGQDASLSAQGAASSTHTDGLADLLETLAILSVDARAPLAGASRRETLSQLDASLTSLVSSSNTATAGDALDWDALLRTLPSLAPDVARRLLPAVTALSPPASALPRLHAAAISALSNRGHDSWMRAAAGALRACGAAVMRTQAPDGEVTGRAGSGARTAAVRPPQRLDAPTVAALLDTALAALARGGAAPIASASAPIQSAVQSERMGFQGGALLFGRREPTRSGGIREAAAPVSQPPPRSMSRLGRGPGSSPTKPRAGQATDDEAGWTSAASQSGTDDHDPQREAEAARTLRLGALNLLSALCISHATGVLPHWRSILFGGTAGSASLCSAMERDPSLAVRVGSMHAIDSLLQGAERAGSLAAAQERLPARGDKFTPLSTRIADMLVELRTRLAVTLQRCADLEVTMRSEQQLPRAYLESTEALLKVTRTFVQATSKSKFLQQHAATLRAPTLSLSASREPRIAVSAYALLGGLLGSSDQGQVEDVQDDETARQIADQLLLSVQTNHTEAVAAQAWQALGALAQRRWTALGDDRQLQAAQLVYDRLASPASASAVRDAAAQALVHMLHAEAAHGRPASPAQLHAVVTRALMMQGLSSTCRALWAEALPAWSAIRADDASEHADRLTRALQRFASDAESTVRAAAARALGVAVQDASQRAQADAWCGRPDVQAIVFGDGGLLRDPAPLVRMRAVWALANAVDADKAGPSDEVWLAKARAARAAAADDERIAVHAWRALGGVLFAMPTTRTPAVEAEARACLAALITGLATAARSPKGAWNGASAISRAFQEPAVRTLAAQSGLAGAATAALAKSLAARSFKAQLSAIRALCLPTSIDEYGGAESGGILRRAVDQARASIDERVRDAKFAEAQLHGYPCVAALQQLNDHLTQLDI